MIFEMIDGQQVEIPDGKILVAWANVDTHSEQPYWAFEQDFPEKGICVYDVFDSPDAFVNAWYGMSESPKGAWYWVVDGDDLVLSGGCDQMDIDIFREHWKLLEESLGDVFKDVRVVSKLTEVQRKEAEWVLTNLTYLDMEEEQLELVSAYEVEQFKPKVDKLFEIGWPAGRIADKIHDWWSDYRMADETEEALFEYVNEKDMELNGLVASVDKALADAIERTTVGDNANTVDRKIEKLWEELEDVPVDENECLDIDWNGWSKGTHREEIWHWFDEHHSKGVGWLMNDFEPNREVQSQWTIDNG